MVVSASSCWAAGLKTPQFSKSVSNESVTRVQLGSYLSAGAYTSSRIPDGKAVLFTKRRFTG